MDPVAAPLAVVAGGLVVLAALTARWVPAVAVTRVDDDDIARDFTTAERGREEAYRRRVRPWSLGAVALGVVVPTTLAVSGLAARVADTVPGPWYVGVAAVVTLVLVVDRLATLPCGIVVRRASLVVGLATGPWRRWWRDVAVAFLLGWVVSVVGLVGWVGAARAWPQSWWVVVAGAAAVLVVVVSFVVPVVVEPLFARFSPMPEGPLRSRLLELARSDGIRVQRVLVADASRRTSALNAYVSGLGRTRRIVVHDTLLRQGRDDEVAAVVAHELGHVAAHDVRTGTLLGAVGAVVGVAAAAVALDWTPLLDATSVAGPADPAVAALLVALGAWTALITAPAQNAVSRRIERRADAHCLELAADASAVVRMHRALAVANLAALRPPRLLQLWFGTHPTSPERIASARQWARAHGVDVPGRLAPGAGDD